MVEQDPTSSNDEAGDELAALRLRTGVLERQIELLEQETQARLIRAELKTEAVRAGMIDLDGLKLVDLSAVKLNARGEIDGSTELIMDMKREKPWLFGVSSSSSASNPPPVQPPRQKLATEMSDDEYRVARAALLKRRR
jgi:hypothetical protein